MIATDAPRASAPGGRFKIIDAVRGAAIVGVVIYHLFWDLSYLGFITTDVTRELPWVLFQRLLAGSFLVLVGVSLVLAHRNGLRWPAFWRRLLIVGGAALGVTVATYWLFPERFVFFGILHAITLFSLLALPFLRAPLWLVVAVAVVILTLPMVFAAPAFTARPLAWIGFWTMPPPTNDLVPVFPWFGPVLLGVAVTRLVLASRWGDALMRLGGTGPVWRFLVLAGRWSLVIYLVHQPILLSGLYPLAALTQPHLAQRADDFVRACESSCGAVASNATACQAYCACALGVVTAADLWQAVNSPVPTPEQERAVAEVTRQCPMPAK